MDNWRDDEQFVKQVAEFGRQNYLENKDNPYAVEGYARLLISLYGEIEKTEPPKKVTWRDRLRRFWYRGK